MTAFTYTAPESLEEAVALLAQRDAHALAGGQSLLLETNRGRLPDTLLVDLRKVQGLGDIRVREQDGSLSIGAMARLDTITSAALIRQRYPALAEAARLSGDAQTRNRATLGGTLADNDPESDLPALILALGAQIHVVGAGGERSIPADAWITGPAQTALAPGELISAITLTAPAEHTGSAYEKISHPATLAAVCGVAAHVTLDRDGTARTCRVAVTGATRYATRLRAVESALVRKPIDAAALTDAVGLIEANVAYRTDRFASAPYRAHLTSVLAVRALNRAFERARHHA